MARVKKVAKSTKVAKPANKHKDEVIKLKKQLRETNALWKSKSQALKSQFDAKVEAVAEEAYTKGYSTALADQIKLDEAFDKFMENAAAQFEKKYLKKIKSSKPKQTRKGAKKKTVRKSKKA